MLRRPDGDAGSGRGRTKNWAAAGIRNYDLEWTASGASSAHYFVTVRGGEVRKVEAVAPDGRKYELHPAEPRFFGVDGLFTTIAESWPSSSRIGRSASPRGPRS